MDLQEITNSLSLLYPKASIDTARLGELSKEDILKLSKWIDLKEFGSDTMPTADIAAILDLVLA